MERDTSKYGNYHIANWVTRDLLTYAIQEAYDKLNTRIDQEIGEIELRLLKIERSQDNAVYQHKITRCPCCEWMPPHD